MLRKRGSGKSIPEVIEMTANFHRDSEPPNESTIHSRLEAAIDSAVEELGLPQQSEAHIRRQKYTYLLIDRFADINDPPVTYSWFNWGVCEWAGPSSMTTTQTLHTTHPQAEPLLGIEMDKMKSYLVEDLEHLSLNNWWTENKLDFLEEFYKHYGHPKYKDLYLANIQLLQTIDYMHVRMQSGNHPMINIPRDPQQRLQDLEREIMGIRHLSDYTRFVSPFAQLFREVIASLEDFDDKELKQGHITSLEKLQEFYRDTVWKIVASAISQYTAKGPNSNGLKERAKEKEKKAKDRFQEEFRENRRRCSTMELLTEEKRFSALEELSEQVDDPQDTVEAVKTQRSQTGQGLDQRQQEAIEAFEKISDDG